MATSGTRAVSRVLKGVPTSDGAGVQLLRVIGTRAVDYFDPFALLDHFSSDDPEAYLAGFPSHPHRGISTLTYILAGRMEHKDSMGNAGELGAGGIQYMSAGSGIIHSEMPKQVDGLLSGFQLWINLPAALKMSQPTYQNIEPEDVPVVDGDGYTVKIIAGEFAGTPGAVRGVTTNPLYLDFVMPAAGADATIAIPDGHAAFVFAYAGVAVVDGTDIPASSAGLLTDGPAVTVAAGADDTRFLLVAAAPLNEPVARAGPFVMNTRAEIEQAFADYQRGELVRDVAVVNPDL